MSVQLSRRTSSLAPRLGAFVLATLALAWVRADAIAALFELSQRDSSASHLVIVPVLSAALAFRGRRRIFAVIRTDWTTGLPIAAGGATLLAYLGSPTGSQEHLGLVVGATLLVWVGMFGLLFGRPALIAARFAVAFLIFAVPFPPALLDRVTAILTLGSGEAVAWLFSATGTPYHREANVFDLPGLSIQIADACSGIRSSIALTLTALLMGHLWLRTMPMKLVLLVAVLPITVLKNGIRIVTLSLLSIHVDPAFLVGRLHTDGGVGFFLLALGMLGLLATILASAELRRAERLRMNPSSIAAPSTSPPERV